MQTPRYARLAEDTLRGRLAGLRNAVQPILAGNYLPSFTDHSVEHSDRVCDLIDQLTEPLVHDHQLSDREAFVLYAAAYLHDAGLQHQRAGETTIVQSVLQSPEYVGRAWADLDVETKRTIVRAHHHHISGEMIERSVNAAHPVLGIQLTDDWHPGQIRSIAVAHNLYMDSHNRQEYADLTTDWGEFRMSLLGALLRLADILDESRRRSQLHLERTRELDLEARMHWWRHYYVAHVKIDPGTHQITLWFEFPPDRRVQYQAMIPPLQIPYLEEEFARHGAVLARHNLLWHFKTDEVPAAQSTSRPMDDELEMYVLERLARRHAQRADQDKILVLDHLRAERPTIERKLSELRVADNPGSATEQLIAFRNLSQHLFLLGGRRGAWTMLWGEYNRLSKSVDSDTKFVVASDLAKMMLDDSASDRACRLLHELADEAESLQPPLKFRFLCLLGQAYLETCAYPQATDALSKAATHAVDAQTREKILAELDEAHLLQGEVQIVVGPSGDGGHR
ncbi:MAG TPA: HD domain-containing protein [Tepidisphaeraceae bacterium]|nr:HD domain-containing protein [Tepidisphaeraceae bacterium]